MQQEQYFKAVPVSEKPKQEGWITVITKEGKQSPYLYTGTDMSFITLREQYTHYLEPIQLPDAALLRSALEKIIAGHETEDLKKMLACSEMAAIAREALSAGDGWVRCEDGNLPTDEGDYLCGYEYNLQGEKVFKQFVAKFGFYRLRQTGELNPDADGITGCFTDHGNRAKLVTHWKPLPSPPIQ